MSTVRSRWPGPSRSATRCAIIGIAVDGEEAYAALVEQRLQIAIDEKRYQQLQVERAKGGYAVANLIKKWHGSFARTGVNWTSGNHTGEFVELCAWGPGSDSVEPWLPNNDLHEVMEQALGLS